MIKNALVAGATGLVGSELVSLLVKTEYYNSIHVITRRPFELEHMKLSAHTIDFNKLDSFKPNALISDVYICLGTTMKKAGSKENFRKVDYDYVVELSRWASKNNVQKIAVISSIGADAQSKNFYLRTKGEMEDSLKALHLTNLIILRPSLLLGDRKEFRLSEKLASAMMRPISAIMTGKLRKYRAVHAREVAHSMFYHTVHAQQSIQLITNELITGFAYKSQG
jgi:uncharacterized protein YbjT (DUF2867 family)